MEPLTLSSVGAVAPASSSRAEVDDFLDVVLADEDLLAAEFDAIIAHAWGGATAPAEPSTQRGVPGPPARPLSDEPGATPLRGPAHPPKPRVRSPPG
ncbi:hypothetical protein [Knoellia aerolata]|uniref:Uncharacterized protein n=1 Tax=Knoellia aerolata DSM 18566 TaxID=1385519 RepID=A0A0A0JQC6_9MICO|nr:hypothetical protein [Knoellia aerolata]KGN39660.1 hypothetical protein N801_19675 [Knoellia aerolata DSM 18566]